MEKKIEELLSHAFKAGRISNNTTFEQWYETFMPPVKVEKNEFGYAEIISEIMDRHDVVCPLETTACIKEVNGYIESLLKFKAITTPSSLPTDEEMKVMALEKVPVEMENERSQAGQYDCKKWDRELYFEGLKDMRSVISLRTNFSSEKCEGVVCRHCEKLISVEHINKHLFMKVTEGGLIHWNCNNI